MGAENATKPPAIAVNDNMIYIYVIIGSVGFIGNLMICLVICTSRLLCKKVMNLFIVNQAITDLLASIAMIATNLLQELSLVPEGLAADIFCRLWLSRLPLWGLFLCSTYNLVLMTYERYHAILCPMKHSGFVTRKKVTAALIFPWIIGIGYNCAFFLPTSGIVDGHCTHFSIYPSLSVQRAVGVVTIFIQYILPLLLITVAYTHISIFLFKQTAVSNAIATGRNIKMLKARRNVIKTLATVNGFFIICWSSNQIYYLLFNFGNDLSFQSMFYHFTVVMVNMNCCVNPIIYTVQYQAFRKALKRAVCHTNRSVYRQNIATVYQE